MSMNDRRTFSTAEVVHLTKVSERQLQWWNEKGIVAAKQIAKGCRVYASEEVMLTYAIHSLRLRGMSMQSIRKFVRGMREALAGGDIFLITDGFQLDTFKQSHEAMDFLKHASRGCYLIDLTAARESVRTRRG